MPAQIRYRAAAKDKIETADRLAQSGRGAVSVPPHGSPYHYRVAMQPQQQQGPCRRPSSTSLLLLPVLLFALIHFAGGERGRENGTTTNIAEIFVGRCWDYQENVNPGPFSKTKKNCSDLWNRFKKVVLKNPSCTMKKDFRDFFDAAKYTDKGKKSLFWSGTKKLVHSFTSYMKEYGTLEDSMNGYIMNDLRFCKQDGLEAFDYKSCEPCNNSSWNSYWEEASRQFAIQATGVIYVLLNATRDQIYRRERQGCDTRVNDLRTDIEERNISMECFDSPMLLRHFICTKTFSSPLCRFLSSGSDLTHGSLSFLLLIGVRILLLAAQ